LKMIRCALHKAGRRVEAFVIVKKSEPNMVFFLQTNLKPRTNLRRALTQIYGINHFLSNYCCDILGLRSNIIVKNISEERLAHLARIINRFHITGGELKRILNEDVARFVRIGSYKGFRFTQGLPLRGQRTHTNAQNARRRNDLVPIRRQRSKKKPTRASALATRVAVAKSQLRQNKK
jgi:small subunit ribosomal protein S13